MTSAIAWRPAPAKVAVFRALNLGDLLCAIPAFRTLRRALPNAHITLIGLPSAKPVVARFRDYIDELVLFPGDPAFPEQAPRLDDLPAFFADMRSRRFDLALQLHGSGGRSNGIVQKLGARQWAGFVQSKVEEVPGRLMAWPDDQPEIRRYLSLLSFLGFPDPDPALEFPLWPEDHAEAERMADRLSLDPSTTVFIHPGARLPSRRWPLDRFAEVGRRLRQRGWNIAVTGSPDEADLGAALCAGIGPPVANLCGATSLGALAALLQRGRMLICNDTGISHVAAAVRLPSVVIASGSDVGRWAPLDRHRHTVLFEPMPCRPCAYAECPLPGHPCAQAVTVDRVMAAVARQLDESTLRRSIAAASPWSPT